MDWDVLSTPEIRWAQAFADRWYVLTLGALDMSDTLDQAYSLYRDLAHLDPEKVANEVHAAYADGRAPVFPPEP